jgi:hypothetical protein
LTATSANSALAVEPISVTTPLATSSFFTASSDSELMSFASAK